MPAVLLFLLSGLSVVDDHVLEGGRTGAKSLVIVLHGGSWTKTEPKELARRAIDALDDDAQRLGLRLLAPLAPTVTEGVRGGRIVDPAVPWIEPAGERVVLKLVLHELRKGKVDARRITLAGHGAGATGALMLAARHRDVFAGVAAWSGTPSPLWEADGTVIGLAEPVPDVPTYLWTGTDDEILDRDTLRFFLAAMDERGDVPFLHEQSGGGHGYGDSPTAGLKFLKRQRR